MSLRKLALQGGEELGEEGVGGWFRLC